MLNTSTALPTIMNRTVIPNNIPINDDDTTTTADNSHISVPATGGRTRPSATPITPSPAKRSRTDASVSSTTTIKWKKS